MRLGLGLRVEVGDWVRVGVWFRTMGASGLKAETNQLPYLKVGESPYPAAAHAE